MRGRAAEVPTRQKEPRRLSPRRPVPVGHGNPCLRKPGPSASVVSHSHNHFAAARALQASLLEAARSFPSRPVSSQEPSLCSVFSHAGTAPEPILEQTPSYRRMSADDTGRQAICQPLPARNRASHANIQRWGPVAQPVEQRTHQPSEGVLHHCAGFRKVRITKAAVRMLHPLYVCSRPQDFAPNSVKN